VGKLVVVTGGSRGIGASTATLLASRGWDEAVGYQRDDESALSVVTECMAMGSRAAAFKADVASNDDVVRLFAAVDEDLGPLDAMVNCAGIVAEKARVDEYSSERIERVFAVNVVGSFLCAGEAVRRMSTRHGGHGGSIVNVSSAASRLGSPGEYVDYAASKGAIDTMTVGLAREVAAEGIRVNAVRPGLVDTTIHARLYTDGPPRRTPGGGHRHRLAVLGRGVLRDRGPPRRQRRPVTISGAAGRRPSAGDSPPVALGR